MIYRNLSSFSVEAVWNDALRILAEVGLMVSNQKVLSRTKGILQHADGWVRFPRDVAEHYAEEIRASAGPPPDEADAAEFNIFNGGVHCYYLDADTGETRPFTTESLVKHTKFILQLGEEGIYQGGVPGYPLDVPPRMQFLTSYYIRCCYVRHPGSQGLATSLDEMRYNIEIAKALGETHVFGVEPLSPLRFVGGSVDAVLEFFEPGMGAVLDSMPIMGITAPMDWHAGWAQSVAENVGGYALLRLCGVKDVYPTFRLFLPNMATGMAYFTSPKHLLALLTRRKVREFFGLRTDWGELLLAASKAPDGQAAAEKMAGCLAGAFHGFRYLEGAGALSLDEVFSAQQLIIDIEIRDYVRSMLADLPLFPTDALAEVRSGVESGCYLTAESTLSRFHEFGWRPRVFDMSTRAGWLGRPLLEKASKPSVEEKAALYSYELGGEKREKLENIMEEARRELS